MTPSKTKTPNDDSSDIEMSKPLFSTPDSLNSVKIDLQKVFSGITTITSDLDTTKHEDIPSVLSSDHKNLNLIFPDPTLENLANSKPKNRTIS